MFFGPEIPGEIARGGFESGLGDGHHVVVGNDLFRGKVSHGHDAAAVGHERGGAAADGDQRVDADVHRNTEAFAAGVDELAAQISGGRKGDGMDEDVELAVLLLQRAEKRVDLAVDWRRRIGSRWRPGVR